MNLSGITPRDLSAFNAVPQPTAPLRVPCRIDTLRYEQIKFIVFGIVEATKLKLKFLESTSSLTRIELSFYQCCRCHHHRHHHLCYHNHRFHDKAFAGNCYGCYTTEHIPYGEFLLGSHFWFLMRFYYCPLNHFFFSSFFRTL